MNLMRRYKGIFQSLIILLVISALQPLMSQSMYATSQPKELLIINSYNESAPWVQDYITPFMLEAAQSDNLNCNLVHMNSSIIRTDTLYNEVADGIFHRFVDNKPDLLVIFGPTGFSLMERIKKEWGDIPVLCLGANDNLIPGKKYLSGDTTILDVKSTPLSDMRDRYNFTFVEVPDYHKETIDMMVKMQPEMKKLVFASDDLATNILLDKRLRDYISVKYPTIEYEWLIASSDTRKELQSYLTNRDLSIGFLLSSWYYSRMSAFGYPMLVTGDISLITTSPRPIFTLKDNYITTGAVGGYFFDKQELLNDALAIFKKILAGEEARNIPFDYPTNKYPMVNYKQSQKDKFDIRRCPEGTVFINKPKSLWELYSWQIIAGSIVLAVILGVFVVFIVFQHKRMAFIASRDKTVNNMPICYITGRVKLDAAGKVVGIDFTSGNYEAKELATKNTNNGDYHSFFDTAYLIELLDNLRKTKRDIKFTHYFAQTDTYYNFQICQTLNDDVVEFFGVNITEEEKKEKSLKETSKTLEMTLAVAHIIPWKWDLTKHLISCEANRILQHLNIPKRADSSACTHVIEENEYFKRIHPEDLEKVKQLYQSLLDGSKQYVKEEFRVVTEENGKSNVDWMEVNASISKFDGNQRPEELIGSLLLITARKRQEANLIAAKEAAKESDRLKSAFLANMSHEIRTPLNAIVGFSNLLTTTEDEEKKQKFINIIENNNQLLLQLIGDILDLAKVEANTLEFIYKPTDLNELVRGIEETMRTKVQHGVVLNYTLGAADCCIKTEPNRLSQVLINLLTNACKFTSKGSVTFGYEVQDNEIYFFVRDTGCGISKEGQARIFQRFTKLNAFAQGTGLGLSISKSIIEKMKGRIGVESKGEGKGSTFWFTIPYLPATIQKEVEVIEDPKEAIEQNKVTLLVAEDNESNYMLFESILGSHYKLIHAWDGIEAVELFDIHNPQLIIMDINMPRMDGYEATREIRKKSTTVPIIAVTAYAFASDKERIMENGFNSYVSKPINAKKLNEELKSALSSHFILL